MATLKVIEILAESAEGWEAAAQSAVETAGETLHNIRSIYIENFEATVENGKVKNYRVNAKITFRLD